MGKGNGSTRASASGNPRGLSASGFPAEVINAAASELRVSIEQRREREENQVRIKLIETGEIAEAEDTWGERLIEHGKAVPADIETYDVLAHIS